MSAFAERLKTRFEHKQPVFIDFRKVREIDYDGLIVLLSVLVRFKAKKIQFNGNFPSDKFVRSILDESHFFDHLLPGKFKDKDSYSLTSGSSIVTHGKRKVDSELGERVIAAVSETVWGERRRCTKVQRALIELMHNTNNHATGPRDEAKHWWLSVKHFEKQHRVAFSFVDFGVGVFSSLRNKAAGSLFYGAIDALKDRVKHGNDAEVLRLVMEGELHRTATGKKYRGKGLPGIYQAFKANHFGALAIITNDVYFNSTTNEFRTLENPFPGTFIYWEVDQSHESLPDAS
jgi:hypothetical protein